MSVPTPKNIFQITGEKLEIRTWIDRVVLFLNHTACPGYDPTSLKVRNPECPFPQAFSEILDLGKEDR